MTPALLALMQALSAPPEPSPTPAPSPTVTPVLSLHAAAPAPTPKAKGHSLAETVRTKGTPTPKKKSLGVITNETLKKDGKDGNGKGSLQIGPARPVAELPSPAATGDAAQESLWRSRASSARQRIETADAEVKRLEAETKRLENDFYAWSDGNYRDRVIKPAWDQAREDLRNARSDFDAAQAAQSDLDEEARKAGVPAGWLREPTPR